MAEKKTPDMADMAQGFTSQAPPPAAGKHPTGPTPSAHPGESKGGPESIEVTQEAGGGFQAKKTRPTRPRRPTGKKIPLSDMEALAAHVSGLQRQMLGEGEEEGKLLAANAVSAANEYVAALFKGLEARVGGIATEVAAQRDDYAAGQSQLLAAVGKANTRLIVLAAAVGYDGQRLAEFIELYTRNPFRRIGGAVAGAAGYVGRALADNALRATFGYVKSDNPLVALRARLNLWAAAKLDPKNAAVHAQYAHYLLLGGNASRASAYAWCALRILEQNPNKYGPTEAAKIKTQAAIVKERATYHLGGIDLESIAHNSPLPHGRYAPIHARTFR